MFTLNELVVYPSQGVGKITRIDRTRIGGAVCECYIVHIRSNNITVMVPVGNARSVGLRALTSGAKAAAILESLHTDTDRTVYPGQNWNRRFREYSERIKSSDLAVVAGVLRELMLLGRTKELSFGERRLQEQSMELVVGELAEVLHMEEHHIREKLRSIYAPLYAASP